MDVADPGSQFALDVQGLQRLKQSAASNPAGGLKEASRQFEALFLQMMLKSMREATPQSGLLDSQQSQFYSGLLDQQWAQQLAGHGLGLAEQLTQQLRGQVAGTSATAASDAALAAIPRGTPQPLYGAVPVEPGATAGAERLVAAIGAAARFAARTPATSAAYAAATAAQADPAGRQPHVDNFVTRLQAPARAASAASGVPAELILAQAALETGWGRNRIVTAGGADSHNLFGIKAGADWRGPTTEVRTTEYVDGQPQAQVERFRVYDSYAAAFTDYARLIGGNPRYAGVVNAPSAEQAAYALQRGGYATDPAYADKLIGVMQMIGPVGRPQLAQL